MRDLPAVLSSSKSTPAPILSKREGIPAPPIILDIPLEVIEEEEEDIIVEEDEKDLEELELIILDPELDIREPKSPPMDIICPPPAPPIFMPSIIFFIISSISRDMPPGPPVEEVVVELEDILEDENVLELEKEPSSLLVEVAIICEAEDESCFTEVLPSSVV